MTRKERIKETEKIIFKRIEENNKFFYNDMANRGKGYMVD